MRQADDGSVFAVACTEGVIYEELHTLYDFFKESLCSLAFLHRENGGSAKQIGSDLADSGVVLRARDDSLSRKRLRAQAARIACGQRRLDCISGSCLFRASKVTQPVYWSCLAGIAALAGSFDTAFILNFSMRHRNIQIES